MLFYKKGQRGGGFRRRKNVEKSLKVKKNSLYPTALVGICWSGSFCLSVWFKRVYFIPTGLWSSLLDRQCIILRQENSRKGFGRSRLSCVCAKELIDSVYSVQNSWDDISRALFVNSPVFVIAGDLFKPNLAWKLLWWSASGTSWKIVITLHYWSDH